MSQRSKADRFSEFLRQLSAAPSAADRQGAFELISHVMDAIENANGLRSTDYVNRMHVFSMAECYGWTGLSQDPCSWIDSVVGRHRTEIYNSGRIVITRIKAPEGVLLDKPGISLSSNGMQG